jgi:hypothetical protein
MHRRAQRIITTAAGTGVAGFEATEDRPRRPSSDNQHAFDDGRLLYLRYRQHASGASTRRPALTTFAEQASVRNLTTVP